MALTLGTRLGPYEVTAQIGVDGMGEVYRARDTKLDFQRGHWKEWASAMTHHCASAWWCVLIAAAVLLAPTGVGCARRGQGTQGDDWETARRQMVDTQIRARGVRDPAVLAAMERVPRHLFVPPELRQLAYDDTPLAIGEGQTISQPFIVAYMTEVLELASDQTVLEIGTGSGYQAAVLAELVRQVYTIEIVPTLADQARGTLGAAGYANIDVRTGNGYLGWPEQAPFPRIIVTAAPPEIPQALIDQLAVGGRMVLPVGEVDQELVVVTKTEDGLNERRTLPVRFVPMVNKP